MNDEDIDPVKKIVSAFGPTVGVETIKEIDQNKHGDKIQKEVTEETKGKVIHIHTPTNIIGSMMSRINKTDNILVMEVKTSMYYDILRKYGFSITHFDLGGQDPFEFKSKSFTKFISVDCIPVIDQQDVFLKDCLKTLIPGGTAMFFFHRQYLTDDIKQYLKDIKCDNAIWLIRSRLEIKEHDTCFIEVKRCHKRTDEDIDNLKLRSLAEIVAEQKKDNAN